MFLPEGEIVVVDGRDVHVLVQGEGPDLVLIHGAGANRTEDAWRRGIHLSYLVGWLRTEENNYLGVPPEIARTLPEKVQELLGYGVHDAIEAGGGPCGYLELRNPMDLMKSGELR